jgi:hypothetical protein
MEVYDRSSSSGLGGEASDSPNFHQLLICWLAKAWICHDMTHQVDNGEPIAHHNIHFETYMEVYDRSSSSGLGGVASDSPAFYLSSLGLALPNFCKSQNHCMTWSRWTKENLLQLQFTKFI